MRQFLSPQAVCALCNDARVLYNAGEKAFERVGEPTEAALKAWRFPGSVFVLFSWCAWGSRFIGSLR